ncbi:hypothetical protein OIU34_20675 [Pararhizobium sp. BT-229]|uniref:hypothetical protein n=1 Tax=Pararhizobium sp. BT-229 TaxID=2986923 RepID=UPI0021F7AB76|nr:hypothetical protein [Pararhizobium sp. BT-229]MCV9964305.1 hypothetical protein [Pararhizobium sp. BT-229]
MNAFGRPLALALSALSFFMLVPSRSDAGLFDVGVDVDAEFGLDKRTMDFINGLAPQVRKEVLQLLKEALPLIDASVISYLNRVDAILDKQISHIQCAAIGTGAALSDDLKGKLPFGGQVQPVAKLEADLNSTITGFRPNVKPHDMRLAYSDLIYRATVANCQVAIASETAKDVAAILENARPRWMVWYRLDGSCPGITQCYSWQEQHTKETISKADKRDVVSADAEKRISSVHQPKTRATGVVWATFNPTEYEKALGELISIEDGINLATAKRLSDANAAIESAGYLISEAKKVLANSPHGPFPLGPDCTLPRVAIAHAGQAMKDADAIRNALAKAVELDQALMPRVQQLSVEFETTMQFASAQIALARDARRFDFGFHGNFGPRIRRCNL